MSLTNANSRYSTTHRHNIDSVWGGSAWPYLNFQTGNYSFSFRQLVGGVGAVYTTTRVCRAICGDYNMDGQVNSIDADLVDGNMGDNGQFNNGDCPWNTASGSTPGVIDQRDMDMVDYFYGKVCAANGMYCSNIAGTSGCHEASEGPIPPH